MAKISDADILGLVRIEETRQRGFVLLLEKYKEQTYWLVRRIVVDHDDANDVTQNTFVKVWQNLEKFREDSKIYTWIYRIATNEAISFLKSKRSNLFVSVDEMREDFGDRLEADVYFQGSDIQRKLQKAVATLPARQKLVFIMRYFEAMSYQEIADAVGVSIGTLKASYHIAVKKIEEILKSH